MTEASLSHALILAVCGGDATGCARKRMQFDLRASGILADLLWNNP
jgi:hypothetical protein